MSGWVGDWKMKMTISILKNIILVGCVGPVATFVKGINSFIIISQMYLCIEVDYLTNKF